VVQVAVPLLLEVVRAEVRDASEIVWCVTPSVDTEYEEPDCVEAFVVDDQDEQEEDTDSADE